MEKLGSELGPSQLTGFAILGHSRCSEKRQPILGLGRHVVCFESQCEGSLMEHMGSERQDQPSGREAAYDSPKARLQALAKPRPLSRRTMQWCAGDQVEQRVEGGDEGPNLGGGKDGERIMTGESL